jgi:heterotetrameric sarcosine oxidase gamma subunit
VKLQPRPLFGATFGVSAPVPEFVAMNTTLLERADIGCLLVNSAVESSAVASELVAAVRFAFPLEAGAIADLHSHRLLWLTPRSWLLHCPVEEDWELARQINEAFPDKRVHAALFTDYLCWFELFGSQAFNLLTEGGFVSLERGGLGLGYAKRTSLAGIAAVVVHERPQTWLIGVERSRAIYFANWLRAACVHDGVPLVRGTAF